MTNATLIDNPLLVGKGLPPFEKIEPEHVVPAITQLLSELKEELTQLEANVTSTWNGLVEPLTRIEERLSWSWGIVGHLMGVKNSPQLREAYETIQPQVIHFGNQLSQSKPLYEAFKSLHQGNNWETLEPAQKRIVAAAIRDAELSGVGLEGEKRNRFNEIQLELAELATKFSNNLLDATKAFKLKLTRPEEIEGLPSSLLSLAAQTARTEGEENATPEAGPWVITLDYPSYIPFLKYSTNRELREKLYKASISRASSGQWNNTPLIDRLLQLRQEQANLLGYNSYAEVSLARKMAPDVETVEKLLEELRSVSYDAAVRDLEDLKNFAQADELKHWDISFWAERQREAKFAFNAEELRPYFPLP
ncbi:MAG: M3 family metallopeptidase, partial [Microcystaceae cyanobacterium]